LLTDDFLAFDNWILGYSFTWWLVLGLLVLLTIIIASGSFLRRLL
jgi:hypothetical protein